MQVSLPLVAIDRASGSVNEISLSGSACTAASRALYLRIRSRSAPILSFSRADLASASSPSWRSAVLQRRQIALDARLHLLHAALNRAARERPVTGIDGLEPVAVDRDGRLRE